MISITSILPFVMATSMKQGSSLAVKQNSFGKSNFQIDGSDEIFSQLLSLEDGFHENCIEGSILMTLVLTVLVFCFLFFRHGRNVLSVELMQCCCCVVVGGGGGFGGGVVVS
jgi:hypothetical protein